MYGTCYNVRLPEVSRGEESADVWTVRSTYVIFFSGLVQVGKGMCGSTTAAGRIRTARTTEDLKDSFGGIGENTGRRDVRVRFLLR
jgi:hypothetical protein